MLQALHLYLVYSWSDHGHIFLGKHGGGGTRGTRETPQSSPRPHHSLPNLGIENLRCRNAFSALGSHLVTTGIDGQPLRVRWLPARAMTAIAAVEPHHARLIRGLFHSNTYVVPVVCVGVSGGGSLRCRPEAFVMV